MGDNPVFSRRSLLGAAGLTAAGSAVLGPDLLRSEQRLGGPTDGWPTYKRTSARTGYAPDASGPVDDYEVQWERKFPDAIGEIGPSPIAVGGDAIRFVLPSDLVGLGTDGTVRWRFRPSRTGIVGSSGSLATDTIPKLHGERTLLTSSFLDSLYSVGPNGTADWRVAGFGGSSVLAGNTLVGVDASETSRTLVAIDATSGVRRWDHTITSRIVPRAAVDDQLVCLNRNRPQVPFQLRDVETGEITLSTTLFRPERDSSWRTSIAVTESLLYLDGATLTAVSTDDGSVAWRALTDGDSTCTHPVVDRDSVYVVEPATGDSSRVHSFDRTTGEPHWNKPVPYAADRPMAVTDEMLYVPYRDGVVGLDPTDGTERFRFDQDGECAVAVAGSRLYVASANQRTLAALEAP